MIYTVTLNPAIDYVIHLEELGLGGLNRTDRTAIFSGGKGINVSVMLKRLGVESVALGFSAGFTGAVIEDMIREKGIRTDFIRLDGGFSRINVKIKAKEETEINSLGPDIPQKAADMLFEKLNALKDGDILVLAGSVPRSLKDNIYEEILEMLKDRKIHTVVDAEKNLLTRVLKYKPLLIKPNHHELGGIFGRELVCAEEIAECAEKLREMGAKNVLVSMAGDGSVLLDEKGNIHRRRAYGGKTVNSVGAGDSMVAGFLAGLEKSGYFNDPNSENISKCLDYALKLGTAAGGATAFSEDLGSSELIWELFEREE